MNDQTKADLAQAGKALVMASLMLGVPALALTFLFKWDDNRPIKPNVRRGRKW